MTTYQCESSETAAARRERLILEQMPQVHFISRRMHEKLPESVALDDLISAGVIGLITAVDNFDESQGVKLKTYAEYKIRGAILDSLRELDWASRHRRKKAKDVEHAIRTVEQRLQRPPSQEEVAAEMGMTLDKYHERLQHVHGLNLESLEIAAGPNGNQTLMMLLPDTEENLPSQIVERAELERLLAESIARLPERERTVLALYYHEELTLREIAEVMGIHISRVAELKTECILRLRSAMTAQWPMARGASK
jgi:RNA polymerase sigma factor for flagellar operon FliA